MAITPKYDNENVTFGYLKEYLKQNTQTGTEDGEYNISGNYSSPPVPPYHKDSLLIINKNIYICKQDRLVGQFSWDDWSLVNNGSLIDNFIENTYKTDLIEIQNQMDNMIQTFYQEIDPSIEWTTSLIKEKHVGDYWYNTTDNTQWRYNKIATTPISYKWEQVNIPTTVYDMIDKKKTIYTSKPTAYSKDDMWIIEETISNDDIPTGTNENPVVKGDWVFCISDNDHYDKNDWVKKDDKVNVQYLEKHYYSSEIINKKFEVINSEVETAISKNKEDILLEVNTKYTTKESFDKVISDYDKEIETIHNEAETTTNTVSALSIEKDRIEGIVSINTEKLENVNSQYDLLSQTINGVTNTIQKTGGSNLLRNAIGYFGGDYWDYPHEPFVNSVIINATGQRSCWLLKNKRATQSISVKNGTYTVSLMYCKLISLANIKIAINGVIHDLNGIENEFNDFVSTIDVDNNTITIELISDLDNSGYIANLMINSGDIALPYSNNANETISDTVTIGKGLQIKASGSNTILDAQTDGIRIVNTKNNENSTEFTSNGAIINDIEAKSGKISKLLFKDTGTQTFITRV